MCARETAERPPTRKEGSCRTEPAETPLAVAIPLSWRRGRARRRLVGWRELRAHTGLDGMDGVRAALTERLRRAGGPLRWDRSARSSCPAGLPLRHFQLVDGSRRAAAVTEEKNSAKTVGSVGGSRRSALAKTQRVFTTVRKAHDVGRVCRDGRAAGLGRAACAASAWPHLTRDDGSIRDGLGKWERDEGLRTA